MTTTTTKKPAQDAVLLLLGNIVDGVTVVGPFDDAQAAAEYAERVGVEGWTAASLEPPRLETADSVTERIRSLPRSSLEAIAFGVAWRLWSSKFGSDDDDDSGSKWQPDQHIDYADALGDLADLLVYFEAFPRVAGEPISQQNREKTEDENN